MQFSDEIQDLTGSNEVRAVPIPPAEGWVVGDPPANPSKHLWLITPENVLSALEYGPLGISTQRGRLAHTNLSGGRPAHCGGEMWFRDSESVWFTGASGRYSPRSQDELDYAVGCLRSAGYQVACCGWDVETNSPARMFREGIEWK